MIFYKGNQPDIQGAFESIADMMEGVIYENDEQIESWDGSRRIHDKINPRTEIEVMEFAEGINAD
jgi:Holliday junction resolvase RusA-like endonuclease